MGFMKPKIKVTQAPPAPNPANPAMDALEGEDPFTNLDTYASARSLINTSSRGLKRRASTQRTSLIGG